jgi:hypothetical protein
MQSLSEQVATVTAKVDKAEAENKKVHGTPLNTPQCCTPLTLAPQLQQEIRSGTPRMGKGVATKGFAGAVFRVMQVR